MRSDEITLLSFFQTGGFCQAGALSNARDERAQSTLGALVKPDRKAGVGSRICYNRTLCCIVVQPSIARHLERAVL